VGPPPLIKMSKETPSGRFLANLAANEQLYIE
jgi:hypothetical protein